MRPPVAIAAVLALALAGCGGDSDSKPVDTTSAAHRTQSKAAFVTQADQVCTLENQQLASDEVSLKRAALRPGITDPKLINEAVTEQSNTYARFAEVAGVTTAQIRKLTPPANGMPERFLVAREDVADLYQAYSEALGRYSNTFSRRDAQRVKQRAAPLRPARAKARALGLDYGFRVCNESR